MPLVESILAIGCHGGRSAARLPIEWRATVAAITSVDEATSEAVLAANAEFYRAFEAQDLEAMSGLWVHDERTACTHPGWPMLHGWAAVSASWFALFTESTPLQFILTDVEVHVNGDTAWVTLDENLISGEVGGTVASMNLFVRNDDGWKLVAHHGGAVHRSSPIEPA